MNLQLKATSVDSMEISKSEECLQQEDGLSLNFGCAFSEQDSDTFQVFFEVSLDVSVVNSVSLNPTHTLHLKYIALFELDEKINEEFRNSLFPKVNAPAIAYPYMRSFISTILLNAGFEPVMLPSVNFQAIANNE